ncbi:protein kinase domain-containing protein [Ktedonospora formicarum]|nr:protein kinase [Ktedonospora formicarum]
MQATNSLTGQIVGGDYLVERLVGKGRSQVVYRARQVSTQERVALTLFLLPEHFSAAARERYLQRFQHEARKIQSLRHPHIMAVYAYGVYDAYPYLVTPYMMHGSLVDVIKDKQRLPHEEVRLIVEQVTSGLSYAHEHESIHGTLKPANIVLQPDSSLLVAGLGLMHMQQMSGIEKSDYPFAHLLSIGGSFVTPPTYLAPEVLRGEHIDKRSDIYALGIILFELLSGQAPYSGRKPEMILRQIEQEDPPSLRSYDPSIPISLELVVRQALEREPQRRFARMQDLAEAFIQVSLGIEHSSASDRLPIASLQEPQQAHGSWQFSPPIVTGKMPAVIDPVRRRTSDQSPSGPDVEHVRQVVSLPAPPTHDTRQPAAIATPKGRTVRPSMRESALQQPEGLAHLPAPTDREKHEHHPPAQEWFSLAGLGDHIGSPNMPVARTLKRVEAPFPAPKKRRGVGRRRVLATLVAGGATVAGLAFALHPTLPNLFSPSAGPAGSTPTDPKANQKPTTGMPGHTVSLPGANQLLKNSALNFINPVDKKASVLVHTEDGQFVAYERACTHVGVNVNYDKGTQMLVCPAHGAIFDPAKGGAVVQGPATRPLPRLSVRVSNDGTLTLL